MKKRKTGDIAKLRRELAAIEVAARDAVWQAIMDHKRSGDPIVVCDNGEVKWVPAEQIDADDMS